MLITGASGFLGQHLVRRFAREGHTVVAIDIIDPPEPMPATFMRVSVEDLLARDASDFDTIVHLAAVVGGRAMIDGNPLAVSRNLMIDQVVFERILAARTTRLVYMSSSAAYGINRQRSADQPPLREQDLDLCGGVIGLPDNTYGWVKLTGEFNSIVTSRACGAPIAIYRPFSVYGPGQADTYPITAIARRALRREWPLTVWGPGNQGRDFVYIDDFLDIVMGTYTRLDATHPLNIATGRGTTFVEVARAMADLVGYDPPIVAEPDRPTGVAWRVGSADAIPAQLRPSTVITDGLSRLLDTLAVPLGR